MRPGFVSRSAHARIGAIRSHQTANAAASAAATGINKTVIRVTEIPFVPTEILTERAIQKKKDRDNVGIAIMLIGIFVLVSFGFV